jgi:hypothetical protein
MTMGDGWDDRNKGRERGGLALGILLIVLGGLFLAGEQLNINLDQYGWPVYVIVPGLALLVIGLAVPNEAGLGMAIPGGVITTVGLILALQGRTNTYASWAYAWALVAPGSVGATLFLYGLLHRRFDLLDAGLRSGAAGLGLFIGFGLLFENVLAIDSSDQTPALRDALPFLAVALGVIIIVLNLLPRPKSRRDGAANGWTERGSEAPPFPPAP